MQLRGRTNNRHARCFHRNYCRPIQFADIEAYTGGRNFTANHSEQRADRNRFQTDVLSLSLPAYLSRQGHIPRQQRRFETLVSGSERRSGNRQFYRHAYSDTGDRGMPFTAPRRPSISCSSSGPGRLRPCHATKKKRRAMLAVLNSAIRETQIFDSSICTGTRARNALRKESASAEESSCRN